MVTVCRCLLLLAPNLVDQGAVTGGELVLAAPQLADEDGRVLQDNLDYGDAVEVAIGYGLSNREINGDQLQRLRETGSIDWLLGHGGSVHHRAWSLRMCHGDVDRLLMILANDALPSIMS